MLGPEGKTVEIQIRTRQMHEDAELGVAAHWKYKEGATGAATKGGTGSYENRIAWLRKLIAWQRRWQILAKCWMKSVAKSLMIEFTSLHQKVM